MSIFRKKERRPRIAYREQRDGTRHYYIEVWACYESGCMYSQKTETTKSLEKAQRWLKTITDTEIINHGVINET